MSNGILVGREVKECVKWNPRWPRGKIKRLGEMLVGREIKESAIRKKKPFFSPLGCSPRPCVYFRSTINDEYPPPTVDEESQDEWSFGEIVEMIRKHGGILPRFWSGGVM